jgi:hypothetical protein
MHVVQAIVGTPLQEIASAAESYKTGAALPCGRKGIVIAVLIILLSIRTVLT